MTNPALRRTLVALAATLSLAASAGCTDDAPGTGARPEVVVTTSILGDVVARLVGDDADVEVIMPRGVDPHEFAPSPRQAIAMRDADVVVANGAGFEVSLADALATAAGGDGLVIEAIDLIEPLADDEGAIDPHFFTDPARVATAARAIADRLVDQVEGLDDARTRRRADAYIGEVEETDAEIERILAAVPSDRRKLVTNHDVFAYFADRYGFEVVGVAIPGGSTLGEPSAGELAELAGTVEASGVTTIFADASSPSDLAEALADEVGADVAVEDLYTESLGPVGSEAGTYLDLIRTDAERIAAGLGG